MERVPSSDSPKKRGASISGWGADGAASDKERRRSSVGRGGGAGGEEEEEGVVTLHSPHKKAKVHADVTAEAQAQGIEDGEDGTAQQVVVELASVAELMRKRGCGLQVRRLDLGHQLAVFWHRDRPYVLNDSCPHRGAPLSEGDIEDLVVFSADAGGGGDEEEEEEEEEEEVPHVVCPLHFYKFALASGRCSEGEDWSEPVRVYEAWVEGDRVMAKLPRLPPLVDDEERDDGEGDADDNAPCVAHI